MGGCVIIVHVSFGSTSFHRKRPKPFRLLALVSPGKKGCHPWDWARARGHFTIRGLCWGSLEKFFSRRPLGKIVVDSKNKLCPQGLLEISGRNPRTRSLWNFLPRATRTTSVGKILVHLRLHRAFQPPSPLLCTHSLRNKFACLLRTGGLLKGCELFLRNTDGYVLQTVSGICTGQINFFRVFWLNIFNYSGICYGILSMFYFSK